MHSDYNYIFFVKRWAYWKLEEVLEPDLVSTLYGLILYSRKKHLTEWDITVVYPLVRQFEDSLWDHLDVMVDEVHQLFFITSPQQHEQIRNQLRRDIAQLQKDWNVANVKKKVEERNLFDSYPQAEKLLKDKMMFSQYYGYISYLVEQFELRLAPYFAENFETSFYSTGTYETQPIKRPSPLVDPEISALIKDQDRFQKVCEHYIKPIKYKNGTHAFVSKREDEYYWKGKGSHKGIPELATLLVFMNKKEILHPFEGSYQGIARTFLHYFNIEQSRSTAETLVRCIDNHDSWLELIESTFPDV